MASKIKNSKKHVFMAEDLHARVLRIAHGKPRRFVQDLYEDIVKLGLEQYISDKDFLLHINDKEQQ